MKTCKISLNSIDKVKAFVNEISKFDCDFDLVSGRYLRYFSIGIISFHLRPEQQEWQLVVWNIPAPVI